MHPSRSGKQQGEKHYCLPGKEWKLSENRRHYERRGDKGWAVSENKRQHYRVIFVSTVNQQMCERDRFVNMAKKVLVVDDEKLIVKGIRFSLEQDGMEVDCAYDGEEALQMIKNKEYDIILLDVMLPKLTGFEVCQQVREFSGVPIVMLTAKGEDMDKILGLEYGADDYITKPFNILEVKARIKAIIRRTSPKVKEAVKVIESGDMKLDCEGRRVYVAGREINLTAKEFELLELLVINANKVYSRENLLKLVWGNDYPGDVRTVDVHIRRLREKIEINPSEPKYVHTKWGVGYYFA